MEAEISQIAAHNLWDQVYAVSLRSTISVPKISFIVSIDISIYLFSREFC